MSPDQNDRIKSNAVHVSVNISAEPSTVWKFLSEGQRFASWIGAFAGQGPMEGTRIDPRVGGEVRVAYPGGNFGVGMITAMESGKRLAMSWGYEDVKQGLPVGSTQIEITLTPTSHGTLVQLTHTGLPSDVVRQGHLGGWKHYLSMLAREAAMAQHQAAAQKAFDTYFRAWIETDEAARLRILAESCEADVRLRTQFACTDGLQKLSEHIAGSLKHMAGFTLLAEGPVQTTHGYARVPWSVLAPGGNPMMRGINVAELSLSGKLASVVSFSDPKP